MALFLSAAQMDEVVPARCPPLRARCPRRRRLPRELARSGRSSAAPWPTSPRMAEAGITRTALILVGPMLDDTPAADEPPLQRGLRAPVPQGIAIPAVSGRRGGINRQDAVE